MSLRDGTKKMSKSDTSDYSRLNMTDDADTIASRSVAPRPIPSRCPHDAARSRRGPRPTTSSASTPR
jgi:tryptophanyl-tRNA synthetase